MRSFARQLFFALISSTYISYAAAAELKTRLVARDIQRSEEVIAVSIQVGDYAELKRQADKLVTVGARIEDTEELGTRVSCAGSAGSLRSIADDLSRPGQAQGIVAARRNMSLYRETMPLCEADVGLAPPIGANLRGP